MGVTNSFSDQPCDAVSSLPHKASLRTTLRADSVVCPPLPTIRDMNKCTCWLKEAPPGTTQSSLRLAKSQSCHRTYCVSQAFLSQSLSEQDPNLWWALLAKFPNCLGGPSSLALYYFHFLDLARALTHAPPFSFLLSLKCPVTPLWFRWLPQLRSEICLTTSLVLNFNSLA